MTRGEKQGAGIALGGLVVVGVMAALVYMGGYDR